MYRIKYSREEVQAAIERLAEHLTITDNSVMLVVANGGTWLALQLMRRFRRMPSQVEMIKFTSYRGFTRKEIKRNYVPEVDLKGKDVIVVDDICDSGITLNAVADWIGLQHPASMQFLTLLTRKGHSLNENIPFITGIEDDSDDFFAGCGMDGGENKEIEFRCLPYICVIDKE